MVRNPRRRTALLDAAIEVLAAQGARGLTFRAVDTKAAVPTGTASNYFSSRDELLHQVAEYVFVRLSPAPASVADLPPHVPDRELGVTLMHDIEARAHADRAGYLALFELRLEAVRSPQLQDTFTAHYRSNLDEIVRNHVDGGFPGDRTTAVLLYLAMTGLLWEQLTLPQVLGDDRPGSDLVRSLVETIVPPR
jgi:DNA-binding transcriptional regulator YbjK